MKRLLSKSEIEQRMVTQLMKSQKQLNKTKRLLDDLDDALANTSELLEANRKVLLQIEGSRARLRTAFNKLTTMASKS